MVEYFDARSKEFRVAIRESVPDFTDNIRYVLYVQNVLNNVNKNHGLRLSAIYHTLCIPFPDNYLLDYKLKKNEPVFEFEFDEKLGKIRIDIDVPDQPVLRDTGDALEYTFTFKKED